MYISNIFLTALTVISTVQAANPSLAEDPLPVADSSKRTLTSLLNWARSILPRNEPASCPPVWTNISTTLTEQFLADGQCTDAARAAIRSAFHDCFNGGCDGSLVLANECANTENRGLERLCGNLQTIATDNNVGMADLIQFAAAHAIKTCPGGPTVPVKIGRRDSSTASPIGILPSHNSSGSDLVKLFASKGFTHTDLAALIGAHTAAKQRTTDPSRAETGMDSTVGVWDNKFYTETKANKAPFTLQADTNVALDPDTAAPFDKFAASKSEWDVAFVEAMVKMSMLGVDVGGVDGYGLVDCTGALPGGSVKREIKGGDVWDRLRW
ncbi:class II peroxidase [Plenodomus tracheiphilus IPT5]|uniref:Peroxidase n=1 Tax=Plenodomus tracheiphilus IPT5 TaxID=1408161 RepID=A0A6A7BI59_9PLEO|nr:class II peroxidase [Plenodomus tracheiphilus IPT5]